MNGEEFISLSIEFDQLSNKKKKLYFNSPVNKGREPEIYWFNIGFENQEALDEMKNHKFISAGFDGVDGDREDQIMNSFIKGDSIVAYASKYGVVGYGKVNVGTYELIKLNSPDDYFNGDHLHRIKVDWINIKNSLNDAIKAKELKEIVGISNPIQTKQLFPKTKIQDLLSKF